MQAPKTILLTESASWFLDFIRGISAQVVVFGHAISFVGIFPLIQRPHAPAMQSVAVVFFFYLSGFLIASTVIRKKQSGEYIFKDYFIERFSRIYSAFIPCLVFVLMIDLIYVVVGNYPYESSFNVMTFIGNLLMLQDFPYQKVITSFGSARPFWTLSIEWWLYMAFGWLMLASSKNLKSLLVKLIVALPFLIVPIYNFRGHGKGLTYIWVLGVFSCILLPYVQNLKWMKARFAIGPAVIFSALALSRSIRTAKAYDLKFGCYMSAALFCFLLFFQLSSFKVNPSLRKKTLFIANYSFTLYLIHYSITDLLNNMMGQSVTPLLKLIICFMLSNVFACILAQYTELKNKDLTRFLKFKFTGRIA